MSNLIESLARHLGIPREKLEREALEAWLERRLLRLEAEIAEILGRYGVKDLKDLERKIEQGKIGEHPTWEDLIVVERLLEEKRKIEEALKYWRKTH